MRTEDLIVELARQGRPVRALRPPRVRFAAWAALSLSITVVAVLGKGPRADASVVMGQTTFVVSLALALATALAAGGAATALSVPGIDEGPRLRWVALGAAGLWVSEILWALSTDRSAIERLAREPLLVSCVAKISLIALVPAAVALLMARRAAPLRAAWTSGLAALGALGFGAAGAQWICPIDRAGHLLLWHVAPVLVLTALAAASGTLLLSSARRD